MVLEQRQERALRATQGFQRGPGGMSIVGKEAIHLAQIMTTIAAMELEIKTGMKMSRGINLFKNVKAIFGFTGSKKEILYKLKRYKFDNYPTPALETFACPDCKVKAIVAVTARDETGLDPDTRLICHPIHGGCGASFAIAGVEIIG
jgi:hypothetical protein